MTTGKAYDNGGPALWSRLCHHLDFTRRQGLGWETAEGRPRDLGVHRRSGTGKPDPASSLQRPPDRAFGPPLQQSVSALEGLHTTLRGTEAARGGLIAGVPGFRTAWCTGWAGHILRLHPVVISPLSAVEYFRLLFAYTHGMAFGFPTIERRHFVVTCKRCRRDVPSGRDEFPFQSVAVECPLCGELRRYLPSEVFLGKPHPLVAKQARVQVR